MNIDWGTIKIHKQIDDHSCIPSAVEMILKLYGKIDANGFPLQKDWNNRADGSFKDFNGFERGGITFRVKFQEFRRGSEFPIEELYKCIDKELKEGRFVIISLPVLGSVPFAFVLENFHMWIIYGKKGDEFLAFSKSFLQLPTGEKIQGTTLTEDVKRLVDFIQGTDILVHEITGLEVDRDR